MIGDQNHRCLIWKLRKEIRYWKKPYYDYSYQNIEQIKQELAIKHNHNNPFDIAAWQQV